MDTSNWHFKLVSANLQFFSLALWNGHLAMPVFLTQRVESWLCDVQVFHQSRHFVYFQNTVKVEKKKDFP